MTQRVVCKSFRIAISLVGMIALGALLRFWHLDLKPLWLDEVITVIFSTGKTYDDLPLDRLFPLQQWRDILTTQVSVSCSQIAQNLATYSTHPPLFFCWMYNWLGWVSSLGGEWVVKLRSLSALFGVVEILAIYYVNRIAFYPKAGVIAAAVMAVSPFAVYLSQEARHYTLPMLLITLALIALVQIQRDIKHRQAVRFWVWLIWAIINSISLYVHYFCILAFIAQIATIMVLMYWHRRKIFNNRKIWVGLILSTSGVAMSFLPWLPIVLNDYSRSQTNWLHSPSHISPLYQTFVGWVVMVIALPIENQSIPVTVIFGLLMLLFGLWIGWQIFTGLVKLWHTPSTHLATLTLLCFSICVLIEFFAIAYLSGKDITAVPRYNFIYYPSFCALIAASLVQGQRNLLNSPVPILLLVGFLSCFLVVSDLTFLKPYQPYRVAQNMNTDSSIPLIVVVAYRDYQDVALGLSFALALESLRQVEEDSASFALLKQSYNFGSFWENVSQLPALSYSTFNLWVVAPGRKRRDYPQQLTLSGNSVCTKDPERYYRIGVPYQMYQCRN
jgi:uncharacterized membrane protein